LYLKTADYHRDVAAADLPVTTASAIVTSEQLR